MKDHRYDLWMAKLPGIGASKAQALLEAYGSAKACFNAPEGELKFVYGITEADAHNIAENRQRADIGGSYEELIRKGINMVTIKDEDYPPALRTIPSPPAFLFYKGSLPRPNVPAAGIVGARSCSEYGRYVARELGRRLSEAGVCVVSGMARGIDAAAHAGALSGGFETYAVLGCGADICYPVSSRNLYRDIPGNGGIISEFCPGQEPLAQNFPIRNRIIAGLSDFIIVVEARPRSGSLITADHAMEQGKDVFAVPGRATDALSYGTNLLIKQGAGIIPAVDDFLAELEINVRDFRQRTSDFKYPLSEKEALIQKKLTLDSKSLDQLLSETGLLPHEVMESLMLLQAKGLCREVFKNSYVRVY